MLSIFPGYCFLLLIYYVLVCMDNTEKIDGKRSDNTIQFCKRGVYTLI